MDWIEPQKDKYGVYSVPSQWVSIDHYEAFNLLFRIENAMRIFVYVVLKHAKKDGWANVSVSDEGGADGTMASIARRRITQSEGFGYLGFPVACPVMHLTIGELTRLIVSDAIWPLFKEYFPGKRDVIKYKLDEISEIRNSLAHFRPVKRGDVEALKQNAGHVCIGIEQFLDRLLHVKDVVPTNTSEPWYQQLSTLGSELCRFHFNQSDDGKWIKMSLTYLCPILSSEFMEPRRTVYSVLSVSTTSLFASEIQRETVYVVEHVPYVSMPGDGPEKANPQFLKVVSFVFPRSALIAGHQAIKEAYQSLLHTISEETELIQGDNLARGRIVHLVSCNALFPPIGGWRLDSEPLTTVRNENDPPEFWGRLDSWVTKDFFAQTDTYPWMPIAVSAWADKQMVEE